MTAATSARVTQSAVDTLSARVTNEHTELGERHDRLRDPVAVLAEVVVVDLDLDKADDVVPVARHGEVELLVPHRVEAVVVLAHRARRLRLEARAVQRHAHVRVDHLRERVRA